MKRFNPGYQKKIGKNGLPYYHKISKELTLLIKKLSLLEGKDISVLEIGTGSGRNFKYLLEENPNLNLFGNDLYESASKQEMYPEVEKKISFIESDTLDYLNLFNKHQDINILISCEHLMHLESLKVEKIIHLICEKIKPEYIVLREGNEKNHQPKIHQFFHKEFYHKFLNYYKSIYKDNSSVSTKYFFVEVLKRNIPPEEQIKINKTKNKLLDWSQSPVLNIFKKFFKL